MAGIRGQHAGRADMTASNRATPIEDYPDELLRRIHADPRTTRRLLDEANDHLFAAAAELEAAGMPRLDAERGAVRRFGPAPWLVRGSSRRGFGTLVAKRLRAAALPCPCLASTASRQMPVMARCS